MKVCKDCGVEKEDSEFNKASKSKDGLYTYCRDCQRIRKKAWYDKNVDRCKQYSIDNRDRINESVRNKRINNPEKYRDRDRKYRVNNRDKRIECCKKWRVNNPDKVKLYTKTHYIENRDAMLEYSRWYFKTPRGKSAKVRARHNRRYHEVNSECTLTYKQWSKILDNQNNRCAICNRKFTSRLTPTRDHIIPLSLGGGLTFENVQALCQSCNSSKNNKIDKSNIVTWGIYS